MALRPNPLTKAIRRNILLSTDVVADHFSARSVLSAVAYGHCAGRSVVSQWFVLTMQRPVRAKHTITSSATNSCRRPLCCQAASAPTRLLTAAMAVQESKHHALELPRAGGHQVRATVHVELSAPAQGLPQRFTGAHATIWSKSARCSRFKFLSMHCLGSKGSTMKQKSLHCACLARCTPKEQKYLYRRSLQRALAAVMVTHMCLRQQSLIAWGWHVGFSCRQTCRHAGAHAGFFMQKHAPAALQHEPGPDSCWAACLRSRGTNMSPLPCTISNGTACC